MPAGVARWPWPHLIWLSLLVFADLQLWLTGGLFYASSTTDVWLKALVTDAVDSGLFYLNWFWLMPYLLTRRGLAWYSLGALGGLLLFVALRSGVGVFLDEAAQLGASPVPLAVRLKVLGTTHLLLGMLILGLSFGLRLSGDYLRERRSRQELEQRQLATELSLLKAQLNPHFLFNTLNNIYSLTLQRSALASEAVLRLSELMRYQLYESSDDAVPLVQELRQLRSFVALQALRLPPEVADEAIPVTLMLPPGAEYVYHIPPMLLLPLVENAFKHGDLAARPHVAWLTLQLDADGRLQFSVRNFVSLNGAALAQPGGLGMVNLQRRLELLYPGRHQLTVQAGAEEYLVSLILEPAPRPY
ncbi:hypothetical protein B0919_00090 [Hymenobacter sp. CRA2]|nr:hypothetical protein B0919_00090 [Hymenobacter sp. CRA2]